MLTGAALPSSAAATVRPATVADFPAVTRLVRNAGLPPDGLAEAHRMFVAEADGHVVGAVVLEKHLDIASNAAFLLRSAVVAPSVAGRGIGGRLVAAALAVVDAVGAPVGLLTETAADYFPRFGFTAVVRAGLPPQLAASAQLQGVCPTSATAMVRVSP